MPTGGAAFIAGAAGGCWGGGGGRRHLACGHSGGGGSFVWHQRQGSGPAFVTQSEAEGELGGGRSTHVPASPIHFGNTNPPTPFWLTAQKAH